ncbi:uncharacterized protein LOC124689753 [Lolium rigidum]|uniref:uncharacterized protein LOC124689753 n=1 Tax=Lolium rigidum TaxID=89674 RepID=UPI001F5C5B1B|nr:uncharacterized protein LOC124689753 [Lolium rigidum]
MRATIAHPGWAFPSVAACSTSCATAASSSTGHALLRTSPSPSTSPGTLWSAISGQIVENPLRAQEPLGNWGDGKLDLLLGMGYNYSHIWEFGAAGGSLNESAKLSKLIVEKMYQMPPAMQYGSELGILMDGKSEVQLGLRCSDIDALGEFAVGGKLRKLIVSSIQRTSSAMVRSFSSQCNYDGDLVGNELRRIGDSIEQNLEVNREILKILQNQFPNPTTMAASSSSAKEALKLQSQDTERHNSAAASPLSNRALFVLSIAGSVVKTLQEWVTKGSAWHIGLTGLGEVIKLVKDPEAKSTLHKLDEERDLWCSILNRGNKKAKAGEGEIAEGTLEADSKETRLALMKRVMAAALAMVEEYYIPLVVAQILAAVVYVLAHITL